MRLQRFSAKNLFSISHVDIDLEKRGLVLVTGYSKDENTANGAGKSTVSSKGIVWTLFGQTIAGQRADDAINVHGDGTGTWGEVTFVAHDGGQYRVSRCRAPDSLRVQRSDPYSSAIQGVTDLTRRDSRETQAVINEALGRDFKTFLQTDFFGQGREKSFLALAPKQQAEVLEEILPIDQIGQWHSHSKEARAKLQEAIRLKQRLHDYMAGVLASSVKDRFNVKQDYDAWQLATGKEIQDIRIRLSNSAVKELEALEANIRVLEHKNMDDTILEKMREDVRTRESHIGDCREVEAVVKDELAVTLERIKGVESRVKTVEDNTCPTCDQVVNIDVTAKLIQEQHDLQAKLKDLELTKQRHTTNLGTWQNYIYAYRDDVGKSTHKIQEIRETREMLGRYREDHYNLSQTCNPKELEKRLQELKTMDNPHQVALDRASEDQSKAEAAVHEAVKDMATLSEEATILDFWVDTFSKKFKNFLFRKACPFLEHKTAEHLKGLANSQLKVTFSTAKLLKSGDARNEFNVKVRSTTGAPSFSLLSGGEQKIVSFAVGLALADLAETQAKGPSKFMILDEPFEYIQGKNCEALVSYLTNVLTKRRETILLVSNDESLKPLVSNQLSVVKERGCTTLA